MFRSPSQTITREDSIMKRLRIIGASAVVAVVLAFGLLAAQPRAAQADPGAQAFCTAVGDFGATHGACVSFFQNGNITAFVADRCRDPAFRAFFGAKNHGQCVKVFV